MPSSPRSKVAVLDLPGFYHARGGSRKEADVEAAIAASAVLSVIYPHMTSVGGDQFWLLWDADRRAVRFLNAGGRAAASGSLDWFSRRGLGEIPFRGITA